MTHRAAERVASAMRSGACTLAVRGNELRLRGDGRAIPCAGGAPPGQLATTTRQIAAACRREAEERAQRTRLEVLVDRLDAVIEACERAHLDDQVDAPAELAARARAAIAAATAVLTAAGEEVPVGIAWRARAGVRIAEVMDAVWEIEAGVLDLLIPARRGLRPCPDRVDDDAPVTTPLSPRPRPPAFPRRPRRTAEAVVLDVGMTWADLFRSAQQIWAWPVGSPERERLCDAYIRAVKQRMPRRWVDVGVSTTKRAVFNVPAPAVSHGCAHCGRPCEGQDAAGVRSCSVEHLLLARITGAGGCGDIRRTV